MLFSNIWIFKLLYYLLLSYSDLFYIWNQFFFFFLTLFGSPESQHQFSHYHLTLPNIFSEVSFLTVNFIHCSLPFVVYSVIGALSSTYRLVAIFHTVLNFPSNSISASLPLVCQASPSQQHLYQHLKRQWFTVYYFNNS